MAKPKQTRGKSKATRSIFADNEADPAPTTSLRNALVIDDEGNEVGAPVEPLASFASSFGAPARSAPEPTSWASLVDLAKVEIRAQLELIGSQRKANAEFDKDLALGTAALMRSLVAAEGEERQRRKAEVRSLSEFQIDQIVEHLRARLPEDEIGDFARKLTGADGEESLL